MIDNTDLRLRNITEQDKIFFNHKIFIVTWNRAHSIAEVAKKLKMSPVYARQKAYSLRKRGVKVKRFGIAPYTITKRVVKELNRVGLKSIEDQMADIEDFIRFWAKAKSLRQVAEKYGISKYTASRRATNYRLVNGIIMKRFSPGRK